MNVFPVSSSILSAGHLALLIKDAYGFDTGVHCELIKAGVNHTYFIRSGIDKYVFRVYSHGWRTESEINEEIRLLGYLKSDGISVSSAVKDLSGNFIQSLNAPEGIRHCALFTFAEGDKIMDGSIELQHMLGQQMAQIHARAKDYKLDRITYTPSVLLQDSMKYLEAFLPADTEEMQFMISTQRYLTAALSKVSDNAVRKGVVHLDIWFDNLVIDSKGKVTIFDFDFCGNGWLCIDIAYYLMQLFALNPDTTLYELKARHFISGYETITALTPEENRILPALGVSLYFFYLGVQCNRFADWSNVFINEVYLKRYIQLRVKKYYDYCFDGAARSV